MDITEIIIEAIKEALEREKIDLQNVIEDAVCNNLDKEVLVEKVLFDYDLEEMALDILNGKC